MEHFFNVEIANEYGVLPALIYKNIEFWVEKNKNEKHFHDDKYWTFISMSLFEKTFSYMTKNQIRKALEILKDAELILTNNFNSTKMNRTIWYTLNDKKSLQPPENKKVQISQMQSSNITNAKFKYHKCIVQIPQMYNNVTDINTDNIAEDNKARVRVRETPALSEVLNFERENGATGIAIKFFKYYELNKWLDKKGQAFNWKQKFLSWMNTEGQNVSTQVEVKPNFKQRDYDNGELNNLFQNVDDIVI